MLPVSLEAVIAARLDTLHPAVKQAAMDAAVIGEVFLPGAVAAIAAVDQRETNERLHQLVAAGFVRRVRTSSVGGQSEYAFLHVLVRDVAYEQIPRAQRTHKHVAAATWIENLTGERVIDRADLIAHHYSAALEHADLVGDDAPELAARARRFLVLAGERAMRVDVATAERFYRRALAIGRAEGQERVTALLGLALAGLEAGRMAESLSVYEEAIALLRSLDDPLRLGKALAEYGTALRRQGETERAWNALAEAVERLERERAGPELGLAYASMAGQEMFAGRPRECLVWSEKAIALSTRLGLESELVRPLQTRGAARCMANDVGGLGDLREALRLGLAVGERTDTAMAYVNLGEELSWMEGPRLGRATYAQGVLFCERHGLERVVHVLRMHTLRPLFDLGQWNELIALADLVARQRRQGQTWIATAALTEQAGVLVRRGELADARSLARAFLPAARRIEDPQTLAPALVCAALIEHAGGDAPAAVRLLGEFEAAVRDRAPIFRALWLADVTRLCAATGALEVARRLLTGLDVAAPRHVYEAQTAHAVVAEAEGRLGEALTGFDEVAVRWRDFGNLVEEAHALFGDGRCLLGSAASQQATERLCAARAIFEQLGERPFVAEVDELLSAKPAR